METFDINKSERRVQIIGRRMPNMQIDVERICELLVELSKGKSYRTCKLLHR
jgi:hypothetical protein